MRITFFMLALLAHFALGSDTQANEQRSGFVVRSVNGDVRFLLPITTTWQPVSKGDRLPRGALLRVFEGEVQLSFFPASNRGWGGDETYLAITQPMLVRLEDEILRKIFSEEHFKTRVPLAPEVTVEEDEFGFLDYAWNRITMIFRRTETNSAYIDELFKKAQLPVEIGVRAKKIKLIHPDHGSAHYAYEYPARLKMRWQRIKKFRGYYYIYVWPASEARKGYTVKTRGADYEISIPEPGSYFVQVAAKNRRYQSEANLVHFGSAKSLGDIDGLIEPLRLRFPQPNVTIASGDDQARVSFAWEIDPDTIERLELVIEDQVRKKTVTVGNDADGQPILKKVPVDYRFGIAHTDEFKTILLRSGSYRWWFEISYLQTYREAMSAIKLDTASEKRLVHVKKVNAQDMVDTVLSQASPHQTFYLIDGL